MGFFCEKYAGFVLVEGQGVLLEVMVANADQNPERAGSMLDPQDHRVCSHAEWMFWRGRG